MGVFSKYHRFREAGEQANAVNVERFGQPARSLFTSTKVFTLHHHIDIVDDHETVVYQSNTKVPSLHDKPTYPTLPAVTLPTSSGNSGPCMSGTSSPWRTERNSRSPTSFGTW